MHRFRMIIRESDGGSDAYVEIPLEIGIPMGVAHKCKFSPIDQALYLHISGSNWDQDLDALADNMRLANIDPDLVEFNVGWDDNNAVCGMIDDLNKYREELH